jgi:hypothetical protein
VRAGEPDDIHNVYYAVFPHTARIETNLMKTILIGLCALGLSAGLISKTAAQNVTIRLSPATDISHWVWNGEYQCWIWNGPEFEGDYQGHAYSYWHGRHQGGGDRNNPPVKGDVGQSRVERPRTEVEKPNAKQPKVEEKRKVEEKSKTKSSKTEDKKDH